MHQEIENLINMAIADGDVTEKERAIILRKAEVLGEDKDEVEMILDGKIALLKKEQTATQPTVAQKSNKEGDLKKCPACGSPVQAFSTKCPDCNHEFSNIEANVSIGKLFEMLNACENERKDVSTTGTFGFMTQGIGEMFGYSKVIEKKKSIISGFPIPNTKDDILEFLSTALPNAKQKGNMFTKQNPENKSHNDLAPTWKSKCEQIIMKAKFSMKEDKKTLEEIMEYAKELGIK